MVPDVRAKCHIVYLEKKQRDPASGRPDDIIFFSLVGTEEIKRLIESLHACIPAVEKHECEMARSHLDAAQQELKVAKKRVVDLTLRIQELEGKLHADLYGKRQPHAVSDREDAGEIPRARSVAGA